MQSTAIDFDETYKHLIQACKTDDTKIFDKYIGYFQNTEYKNEHGWTLLIMAAFAHSYAIVKKLLGMGADVNAANNKGTTVLMYAKTKVKENNNFLFLDYLIENGADPNKKDMLGKTVLDYVKDTNNSPLVKYFEQKLTVDIQGKQ